LKGESLDKIKLIDFGEDILDDEVCVHQSVLSLPNMREVALIKETIEERSKEFP